MLSHCLKWASVLDGHVKKSDLSKRVKNLLEEAVPLNDQYIVQMLWNHWGIYFLFSSFSLVELGRHLKPTKSTSQLCWVGLIFYSLFYKHVIALFNGAATLRRWLCLWYKCMYACIMMGGKPFWLFCWFEMSELHRRGWGGFGCTYFSLAQWNSALWSWSTPTA